jgi:hypothetical protein
MTSRRVIELAVLRAERRQALPDSSFAIPGQRKYPIHDLSHARNALSRVAQQGTPEEQRLVRAAVARKYGAKIGSFRRRHHNTAVEDQKDVQLARPAGFADHKPPYDFKHGWVPVSGAAAAKVKADKPAERQLPPALRTKPAWKSQEDHDAAVDAYFKAYPEGWKDPHAAPDKAETPLDDPEPPKKVSRSSGAKRAGRTAMPAATSKRQREALKDEDYDQDRLTAEWESSIKQGDLDSDEQEAIHQWQNGYTEVPIGDDPDEVSETGLYLVLNDMLRDGGKYDLGALDEDDLENLDLMNNHLRSALDKSEVTKDTTVFRGVSQLPDVKVGDTFQDPGWQAATYNPNTAKGFLGGGEVGAGPTKTSKTLVISLPKGSKALRVRERESHERVFGIKHEIVIGPDTPMVVTGIKGDQIFLEVQPEVRELSSDHSSSTHPDIPNKPGKTNWVENTGGLPSFIRRVARHIRADGGLSTSHAIAAAVQQCRDGRFGAKGLAAYAQFKAQAAASKASHG